MRRVLAGAPLGGPARARSRHGLLRGLRLRGTVGVGGGRGCLRGRALHGGGRGRGQPCRQPHRVLGHGSESVVLNTLPPPKKKLSCVVVIVEVVRTRNSCTRVLRKGCSRSLKNTLCNYCVVCVQINHLVLQCKRGLFTFLFLQFAG